MPVTSAPTGNCISPTPGWHWRPRPKGRAWPTGPRPTAQEDLLSGRLVRPFTSSMTALGQYALVCERLRLERPAVAQMLEWFNDQLLDRRVTRTVHTDVAGVVLAESWTVRGGGHAWYEGARSGPSPNHAPRRVRRDGPVLSRTEPHDLSDGGAPGQRGPGSDACAN